MNDESGPETAARPESEHLALLRRASLFSELPTETLTALVGHFSERTYARGATVWHVGDEGGELLVVASGELAVLGLDAEGAEQLVGRIGPGECAGEIALVLGERRSATVVCTREARVLALDKEDFHQFVRGNAAVLISLAELLSRRAVALAQRRPVNPSPIVVGVVADAGVPGASLVAKAVAQGALRVLGCDALLIRIGDRGVPLRAMPSAADLMGKLRTRRGLPPVLDVALGGSGGDAGTSLNPSELATSMNAVFSTFKDRFRLIVIDLPFIAGGPVELAASACEYVVHVVAEACPPPATHARVFQVVNRYKTAGGPMPVNHCEPFVLPFEPSFAMTKAKGSPLPMTDITLPAWRVLHRLTRKLLGVTVGVALGGGGAFGIAHVGVLLALAEADIPVDLVAGTSMGSIVALGYAAGIQPAAMVDIARRIGNVRTALSVIDPSLTGTGLLRGHRLVSIFAPFLAPASFDELEVPCRVVAMDLDTGARVDIGAGRVDTAFRASCSIPVVFNPVRLGGRTLVDGGMIDPVPADVVRDMGADVVIAVNVVPRLEPGTTTTISRTYKWVSRLNPLSYLTGSQHMPDIIDVFMNSLQATQFELGNYKALTADVLLNVDLAGFTWIDFHRALEIIECGSEAGRRALPEVRAAFDQRLEPSI